MMSTLDALSTVLVNCIPGMSETLRTSVAVPGGVAFFTSSFESAKALLRLVVVGAMTADCSMQKCC
jgi:hypothetical protein